jgi:phage-related minor tail protein
LLQAIAQATGMSSKQMDSNAELKMYLAAATDPLLDIQSNKRALQKLKELYGIQEQQMQPTTQNPNGGWSIERMP